MSAVATRPATPDDAMRSLLKERGWSLWYSDDYWVHPKTVRNPAAQDYTNYGMPLERAYRFETTGEAPFGMAPFGGIGGPGSGVRP